MRKSWRVWIFLLILFGPPCAYVAYALWGIVSHPQQYAEQNRRANAELRCRWNRDTNCKPID